MPCFSTYAVFFFSMNVNVLLTSCCVIFQFSKLLDFPTVVAAKFIINGNSLFYKAYARTGVSKAVLPLHKLQSKFSLKSQLFKGWCFGFGIDLLL